MSRSLVLGFAATFFAACSPDGGSTPIDSATSGGAGQGGRAPSLPLSGGTLGAGGQAVSSGGAAVSASGGTGGGGEGGQATAGTAPSGGAGLGGNGVAGATMGGSASQGGTVAGSGGATNGGATVTSGGAPLASGGASAQGGQVAAGGATAPGGGSAALVPANGALLGGFIGAGTIEATEAQLGRKWAIELKYFDWPSDYAPFARSSISAGRIPYVTIEPWTVALDAIASGAQDAVIQSRANGVKALSGKVLLRFAHEMNGNWYPWDGAHNGANAAAAQKYIAAYRHLHDVFTSAGATNVLWVFCPNVDSVPSEGWNAWQNYYPGDAYVDWTCFDGYNWATDTFVSMTARIYPGLAAKNKPILLGETSTKDVEKAAWLNAILPALETQFPLLKALVWFHVNKENDWRYDSSPGSLAAFKTMANDAYFNP